MGPLMKRRENISNLQDVVYNLQTEKSRRLLELPGER